MKDKVNVLGTEYKIIWQKREDNKLYDELNGWVDQFAKKIYLLSPEVKEDATECIEEYRKKTLRHEITHAFLFESGLAGSSYGINCWAENEEMVDWIAWQGIKIYEAWKEAGAI